MRAMFSAALCLIGLAAATAASAQSVEQFYRGRQINLIVGFR